MSRIDHHPTSFSQLLPILQPLEAAAAPLRTLVQTITGWHPLRRIDDMLRVARTRRDLRDLDDRMLNDIGVTRVDIDREARRRFWDIDPE